MGAELFHANGQTDEQAERQTDTQMDRHKETTSRFSQFCQRAE